MKLYVCFETPVTPLSARFIVALSDILHLLFVSLAYPNFGWFYVYLVLTLHHNNVIALECGNINSE